MQEDYTSRINANYLTLRKYLGILDLFLCFVLNLGNDFSFNRSIVKSRIIKYSLLYLFVFILIPRSEARDLPVEMLGGQSHIDIPFSYISGYILVDVEVNETLTLPLILDTGSQHTILFNQVIAHLLQLEFTDTINVIGSDMSTVGNAFITRSSVLQLENAQPVKHDLLFLENNITFLQESIGRPVAGILGISYFDNLGIELDYIKGNLKVMNQEGTKDRAKRYHHSAPITIEGGKPHIEVSDSLKYLIDTGASLTFLSYIQDSLSLPGVFVEGILGKGLGGDIYGYMGLASSVDIFNKTYESILMQYQLLPDMEMDIDSIVQLRDGLVGNYVLSNFTILIDLLNNQIYTRPNRWFKPIAEYNRTGIHMMCFGQSLDQYYIYHVDDLSPGQRNDVQIGDIIKSVNFRPSPLLDLNKIASVFSRSSGKKVRLKLERNGEILIKKVILYDYLRPQ